MQSIQPHLMDREDFKEATECKVFTNTEACPFDVKLGSLCRVAGFPSDEESCHSFIFQFM